MLISIKIFLNIFENFNWVEKLGQIFDLENTEFELECEYEVDDELREWFNFNDLSLGGASLNIPHHLKNEITNHFLDELYDELNEQKAKRYDDMEVSYQLN